MKKTTIVLILIIATIGGFALLLPSQTNHLRQAKGFPWQIETLPDGNSKVFGLILASSTLGEARERISKEMEIAVIAAPGEPGALEAYYGDYAAGIVAGKLILVADVDQETVARLRGRAVKSEYMDSTTRKYILDPADLALAYRAPIAAITFIPAVNLDEQTVLKRFGTPHERLRTNEHTEHFLYPEKGLDLMLDSRGKEVLQYVAPRQFARLREPLIRAAQPGKK